MSVAQTYRILNAAGPVTAPAAPGLAVSNKICGLSDATSLIFQGDFVGGTAGTMDVVIQFSPDGGTTWREYARFVTVAAGVTVSQVIVPAIMASAATSATVGAGTPAAPVIASGTCINGHPGDAVRIVIYSNAGTSAGGTVQVRVVSSAPRR